MDTPGFDPVSATGQIAGGANLIAFTTGRGSMFGSKPAPCIKLATNTPMFNTLEEDMDINCGEILDGTASVQEMGAAHLRAVPAHRLRRAVQEREARPGRPRVRALADRDHELSGERPSLNIQRGIP